MAYEENNIHWPPQDGKEFIRSNEFGKILISLVRQFTYRYPQMDFTDAVAHVFTWFDKKLSINRRFINSRRFPTVAAFRAYVRQSIWNAALITQRERQRHKQIEAPSGRQALIVRVIDPEERAMALEAVESLPEPHKTVFNSFFFDEQDLCMLASIIDRTEAEIHQLYVEAVDMLRDQLGL
jgi:hypothetical protein